jgi:hypothetical protein
MPARVKLILHRFHPSAFLFSMQLLLLALYAVFDDPQAERSLVHLFGILIPMLVVWVVHSSPAIDWIARVLAIPAFALSLISLVLPSSDLLIWIILLEAPLYLYAAFSLTAYMLEDYEVTTDEIYAAGATFTMLAWAFAYLFLVCQSWAPGSFISSVNPGSTLSFIDLLFLSFTNLSSVGLSDIVPTSTTARVLLMFEQFIGVGYVAVVVSRLVGLTIQRRERRRH